MPKKASGAFDQMQYQKDYNNQHVKWRKVSFNDLNPDDEILKNWIDQQNESTSSYLKRLVRQDMESQNK